MKKTNLLTTLALPIIMAFGVNTANAQNDVSKVQDGKVSIEAIPTTLDEFKTLQAELGTTPEGCIMLQLVAMEMYRRDKNVGRECLSLNNTSTNLTSVTRRLDELYRPNDSYSRPYLVSSCFKGATPANGYNPNKPFTIEVRRDPVRPNDERSQMLKGYVKYFQLYSDGYDTHWRNVDVVQQHGDPYYRVSNCPAILTQCKEIDFDATDEWHGLE
jgi:hypothetical protein